MFPRLPMVMNGLKQGPGRVRANSKSERMRRSLRICIILACAATCCGHVQLPTHRFVCTQPSLIPRSLSLRLRGGGAEDYPPPSSLSTYNTTQRLGHDSSAEGQRGISMDDLAHALQISTQAGGVCAGKARSREGGRKGCIAGDVCAREQPGGQEGWSDKHQRRKTICVKEVADALNACQVLTPRTFSHQTAARTRIRTYIRRCVPEN